MAHHALEKAEDAQPMKVPENQEELLELIWLLREDSEPTTVENLLAHTEESNAAELLETMQQDGLIEIHDGKINLLPLGEELAAKVIRRHRLAEVLLSEILELPSEEVEDNACRFEHILSEKATDSVCTLLGHPPKCPHGRPIPRGPCCARFQTEIRPLVTPLTQLRPGAVAKIVFIHQRRKSTLDRLSAFHVVPGTIIKLHQKHPSYVIQVDQTEIALDSETANEIYVREVEPSTSWGGPRPCAGKPRHRHGPPWRFG
jgi:DtxR family Mn-dependent transcriptional regulator